MGKWYTKIHGESNFNRKQVFKLKISVDVVSIFTNIQFSRYCHTSVFDCLNLLVVK